MKTQSVIMLYTTNRSWKYGQSMIVGSALPGSLLWRIRYLCCCWELVYFATCKRQIYFAGPQTSICFSYVQQPFSKLEAVQSTHGNN